MYKNSRRDGQADDRRRMVESAEERADPGDEVMVELPRLCAIQSVKRRLVPI